MAVDQFLRNSAHTSPHLPAVLFDGETITYEQLDQDVDNLAGSLLELGLKHSGKVGVILGNTPDYFRCYFGILRAGGVIVPINPLLKGDEITHIINDAEVSHIIISDMSLPTIKSILPKIPTLNSIIIIQSTANNIDLSNNMFLFKDLLARKSCPVCHDIKDSDLAACLYTSGTSGKPKGALLSHGNLKFDAVASTERITMNSEDRHLCILPLFHTFAQMACMIMPIRLGCSVTIIPQFIPSLVLKEIEDKKITFLCAVPAMYTALLSVCSDANKVRSLRICVSGGAPLPLEITKTYKEKLGITIIEGNGPTETSPVSYVNPPLANKPGTVGPPLDGVQVKIVDDSDNELPIEQIGEICIKGPHVMQGYLNLPEATAAAMKGGWFHTGDIGKIDHDGYVSIIDRKKDMIIVAGMNVYPREIEECLYQHPKVLEAAVIGVRDPDRDEIPQAIVVLKQGIVGDPNEFILHCRKHLAIFKCPRTVTFSERLPKNSSGKIDKKQIKELLSMGLL